MHAIMAAMMLAGLFGSHARSKVIVIDMVRDEQAHMYFAPSKVRAERGDTLRFVVRAGTHDIYFLPDSNPGVSDLPPRTIMAERPGEVIDVVVTFAPGHYYFQCDPHVSRGMIGHLDVADAPSSVVFVVRHADKAVAATNDPPLSTAGRARAATLADRLRDAGLTRVIVDQSERTQQTAAPFTKLRPEVLPIDWANPTPQVHAIADSARRPGVTLVIAHRNTVPAIIQALGGPVVPEVSDSAYDDLYMLVLQPGVAPVFVHAAYK